MVFHTGRLSADPPTVHGRGPRRRCWCSSAQSENRFEGLGQWDCDLARAARREFAKLLVAGRCDRGVLMVSREAVDEFAHHRGFAGYLEGERPDRRRVMAKRDFGKGRVRLLPNRWFSGSFALP